MQGALLRGNPSNRQLHRSVFVLMVAITTLPACVVGPSREFESRATDIQLPMDTTIIEDRVPLHATLDALLRVQEIGREIAHEVVAAAHTVFNPRALRAGQPYTLVVGPGGLFRSFEYAIDNDRFLRVAGVETGEPETLKAEILTYPKLRLQAAISGRIDPEHSSLVAVVDQAGERVDLALRLAEIFSGQLDFNADLQPGDRVQALFEKDSRDGTAGYFDENGHSVRRFFLRSPLPFNPRITSRFSLRRLHPVYGVRRAHLGVDYAAPIGTPVLAVADGVVVSAGFNGASGRVIRLRHANGFQTYYLHLSSIAKGLRPGVRVSQGDVIGRVGASGVVTGPHLDYRLTKGGVFVNPLVEQRKLPPGEPIPA